MMQSLHRGALGVLPASVYTATLRNCVPQRALAHPTSPTHNNDLLR